MQKNESHDAGASGLPASPLNHEVPSGGLQPSAKLLEKLAKWRIDQSSIEFPKDAPKFRGGNATVVKGFLAAPSGVNDQKDQSDAIQGKSVDLDGPEGETSRQPKVGAEQLLWGFIVTSGDSSTPTSQLVAVKKMNISDDRERVLGLTLREAGFLVDLSHQNVIELEGFVEDLSKDIIWLVFPWEDNGTLRDFIASADWEIPERISLIDDVTRGVEYLHGRTPPIRHGDLKSINILVNSECLAIITDFGSARRLGANLKDTDKQTSRTENTGIPQAALSLEATFCSSTNTMGITLTGDKYTLRWAPPEVLREEEACLGSDIWALGWVAYEVMTNTIPFQDVVKDAIVIKRVVQGDLPSITDHALKYTLLTKSIQPMIIPNPIRTTEAATLRARSPALLVQLGDMHRQQGDYANALDFYNNALGSYRDIDDKEGESAALYGLAQVHRFRREYSQAVTFYSEALRICTDIADRKGRSFALFGLADMHRQREEYSQAVTFYSEALQIRTDIGDRPGRAPVLLGLAEVHRNRKEYNQAIALYSDALQIQTDFGDRGGKAETLRFLAEAHRLQHQYSEAITLNSESLNIATDLGDRYGRAEALLNLADVHRDQGNFSDAICPYTQAAEIYQQIGHSQQAAYASQEAAQARRFSERGEAA